MALFSSRFQHAENPLLCPSGAKGAHFAGMLEDCWLVFADSKRTKTVWWTKSRANHSPPPNPVKKSDLRPNWFNLPFAVIPDRMSQPTHWRLCVHREKQIASAKVRLSVQVYRRYSTELCLSQFRCDPSARSLYRGKTPYVGSIRRPGPRFKERSVCRVIFHVHERRLDTRPTAE